MVAGEIKEYATKDEMTEEMVEKELIRIYYKAIRGTNYLESK